MILLFVFVTLNKFCNTRLVLVAEFLRNLFIGQPFLLHLNGSLILGFPARVNGDKILKRYTFTSLFEGQMIGEEQLDGLRLVISRQIVTLYATQMLIGDICNVATQFEHQTHLCLECLATQKIVLRRHEHLSPLPAMVQEDDKALVADGKLGILHQEQAHLVPLVHAACIEVGEAIHHDKIRWTMSKPFVKVSHNVLTVEQKA